MMDCQEICHIADNIADEAATIKYHIGGGNSTGVRSTLEVIRHHLRLIEAELEAGDMERTGLFRALSPDEP